MAAKNPAEPKLDKIRLLPQKISLFAPIRVYDQKLKERPSEHMRQSKPAGS